LVADLPPGQKTKLTKLKALIDDDTALKDLSKEQEEELINNLLKYHENRSGIHANNTTAAWDILCTSDIMTDLVHTFIC